MAIATMRELLEAGIHFGHQTRRWHPKMKRYIFGQRNGIYIVDLQQTLRQIYKAYGLVRDSVAEGGQVLFVGTKKQAQEPIQREAQRCGMHWVTNRWLGGTLTNFQTVRTSIDELKKLQEMQETGKIEAFGKKEAIILRKRQERLEKNISGIQNMLKAPDIMFVIDAKREHIAVREAARLKIPCIGITDTNCDPDVVSLPIPGNDDAIRAINLFCKVIADAAIEGKMRAEKKRADELEEAGAREKSRMDEREEEEEEKERSYGPATSRDQNVKVADNEPTPAQTEAAAVIDEGRDLSGGDANAAGEVPAASQE